MWGPLIAGGLSLASGFFANKSAKKQMKMQMAETQVARETNARLIDWKNKKDKALGERLLKTKEVTTEKASNSVNVADMMKAAEAAGINPITFIRNGGLAAFTQSDSKVTRSGHNAVAAFQMMSPQVALWTPGQIPNVPSMGEAVANAGMAAFNQYNSDRVRQETQNFQRELLNTQLAATQASGGGAGGSRSFYVPGFSTSGPTTTTQTRGGLAHPKTPSAPPLPTPGDRNATSPWSIRNVDPTVPDAEQSETRYGDFGQEVAGLSNFIDDVWYNVTGKTKAQRWEITKKYFNSFVGGLSIKFDPDTKHSDPLFFSVKPTKPVQNYNGR